MLGKHGKKTLLDSFMDAPDEYAALPWKVFDNNGIMILADYCPFADSAHDNMIVDFIKVKATYIEVVVKDKTAAFLKDKEAFYSGR